MVQELSAQGTYDGTVTYGDLETISRLGLVGMVATDSLEDLNYMPNLTSLRVENSTIGNLESSTIQDLDYSTNNTGSLDALTSLRLMSSGTVNITAPILNDVYTYNSSLLSGLASITELEINGIVDNLEDLSTYTNLSNLAVNINFDDHTYDGTNLTANIANLQNLDTVAIYQDTNYVSWATTSYFDFSVLNYPIGTLSVGGNFDTLILGNLSVGDLNLSGNNFTFYLVLLLLMFIY